MMAKPIYPSLNHVPLLVQSKEWRISLWRKVSSVPGNIMSSPSPNKLRDSRVKFLMSKGFLVGEIDMTSSTAIRISRSGPCGRRRLGSEIKWTLLARFCVSLAPG
jgi:hypothetical protein